MERSDGDLNAQSKFRPSDLSMERSDKDLNHRLTMDMAEKSTAVDLRGRPVDMSKTGTWKTSIFFCALNSADYQATVGVQQNLVPYLIEVMHRQTSKAANINTNFSGTCYLLALLGGFVADSYLGSYWTIATGLVAMCLGLGLLTLSTAYSELQPGACTSAICSPAGARYMAPLYVALYTIALGSGLVKPNILALGADQFDYSSPTETKQSVHFYVWFYFFTNIGLLIAFTIGVYLQDNVSRSWGYGFALMFYAACGLLFLCGTPKYRHTRPAGSFVTRTAQVLVASLRKRKSRTAAGTRELYDPATTGRMIPKLSHTKKLRFLDRAAMIGTADKDAVVNGTKRQNPWKLCSVSQVEETKRLLQLIPIWASTTAITLVFSQLITFTVQQGSTFDRRLGPHFKVPPASLSVFLVLITFVSVPIYDRVLVPIVRRYTGNLYGFTPLQRIGASLCFAVLTMITAGLIERKRLTYVRELHLEALPLSAFTLPISMWWLIPQFFLAAMVELFFYVAAYQFFYLESSASTRSIGSSFTYAAAAIGYYLSTVLVQLVNRVTRHQKGGSWLEGRLNDGGLEKFYWLLAVIIAIDFLMFLIFAHFYHYKYNWSHELKDSTHVKREGVDNGDN